jgi:uncharacterized protein (UPF0335 family)
MRQTAPTHIVCEQNEQVDLKLKKFVENIEALEENKKEISQQISDHYKEAKAVGFDAKTMRKVIALRKLELDERMEAEQLLETYKEALNMA